MKPCWCAAAAHVFVCLCHSKNWQRKIAFHPTTGPKGMSTPHRSFGPLQIHEIFIIISCCSCSLHLCAAILCMKPNNKPPFRRRSSSITSLMAKKKRKGNTEIALTQQKVKKTIASKNNREQQYNPHNFAKGIRRAGA